MLHFELTNSKLQHKLNITQNQSAPIIDKLLANILNLSGVSLQFKCVFDFSLFLFLNYK